METIKRISELQPISQETISILERAGSRGNSTIKRPVDVSPPGRQQGRAHLPIHMLTGAKRKVSGKGSNFGLTVDNSTKMFSSSEEGKLRVSECMKLGLKRYCVRGCKVCT